MMDFVLGGLAIPMWDSATPGLEYTTFSLKVARQRIGEAGDNRREESVSASLRWEQ